MKPPAPSAIFVYKRAEHARRMLASLARNPLAAESPITVYCDRQWLTTSARLELFMQVCEGVQHAHQKGVIHRDLKPSNVLVAVQDDRPVPKIIDFGVAKATAQQLTDRTPRTEFGAIVGTLETLPGQHKQIVLSSDRPPKAMITLEERLRSRFEWGLTADIQPPDMETRQGILRDKAERMGKQFSNEMTELIARRVQSNIRELEGALTKVAAFADLSGLPVTSQLVETALVDPLPRRGDVQPDEVVCQVARAFGLTADQMRSRDRSRQVALPRQIAMFLMREEANVSLPQIGEVLRPWTRSPSSISGHSTAS